VSEVFGAPAPRPYTRGDAGRIGLFDEDYFAYQEEWGFVLQGVWPMEMRIYPRGGGVYIWRGDHGQTRSRRHIF
jgi:hypothetical protein